MKPVDLMVVYLNECQLHAEVLADAPVGCADRRIYRMIIQKDAPSAHPTHCAADKL